MRDTKGRLENNRMPKSNLGTLGISGCSRSLHSRINGQTFYQVLTPVFPKARGCYQTSVSVFAWTDSFLTELEIGT